MDEVTRLELRAIRELIEHNERARDSKDALEHETIKAAKVELDARLTRMNEFRQAMADQAAQFITRPEFEAGTAAGIERHEASRDYIDAQLTPMRADLGRVQKTDWGLLASVGGLVFGLCAGCWLIIGLQIDNRVGPIRVDMEQTRTIGAQNAERLRFIESATAASSQADVASRADRSQLNERIHQIETTVPPTQALVVDVGALKTAMVNVTTDVFQLRAKTSEQAAALIEIETQFCGQDNLRSQIHAQDLRLQAMLWKKTYGDEMPITNAFYGRVGRCGPGGTGGQ